LALEEFKYALESWRQTQALVWFSKAALLNFMSARSFLSTLFVHASKALIRPSSLNLGSVDINDSEDRRIFSDLSQYVLY